MTERAKIYVKKATVSKRIKIFFSTAVLTVVLLVFQVLFGVEFSGLEMVVISSIFGLMLVLLGMWVIKFKGSIPIFIKIFTLPFLTLSILVFTLQQLFFTKFSRFADYVTFFAILLVFAGIVYVILLTVNILYISTFRVIPLAQVAHSVWYILTLIVVFLFTYWVILANLEYWIALPVLYLTYFGLVLQHFSHFELGKNDLMAKTVGISMAMFTIFIVTALWPTYNLVKAFSASLTGYVGIGLMMHDVKKILDTRVIVEYFLLFILFMAILIYTSGWGIHGRLLGF